MTSPEQQDPAALLTTLLKDAQQTITTVLQDAEQTKVDKSGLEHQKAELVHQVWHTYRLRYSLKTGNALLFVTRLASVHSRGSAEFVR